VLDRVPGYASGGYYWPGKTPEKLAEEMAGYVSEGFKAVKMKVGLESVANERKRIQAVREAIGDDVRLMLDANNAWKDLPTALEYARCFEPYNPFWLEEPFSPDDIDNHARLAKATPITYRRGRSGALAFQRPHHLRCDHAAPDRRNGLRRHNRMAPHRGNRCKPWNHYRTSCMARCPYSFGCCDSQLHLCRVDAR
jgi:hypothetical protein